MSMPNLKSLQARYPALSDPKLRRAATRRRQNQEDAFDAEEYLEQAEANAPILNKKLQEVLKSD